MSKKLNLMLSVDKLVAGLTQAAILFDPEGKVVRINQPALDMFGITKEGREDKWFDHYIACPREYQQSVPKYLAHYQEANEDQWKHPVMANKATGERFPLSYKLTYLPDDENPHFCLCLLNDIEAAWKEYKLCRDKSEEFETMSRAKTQFLQHLSQELRLPINMLLNTVSEVLDHQGIPATLKDELLVAFNAGKDVQKSINEMNDFTRLESNKLEFQSISFNFRAMLEEIVDTHDSSARRKNLELATLVSPYVPEIVIGDPDHIQQIIQNYLNNAIRFTSEGGITVRANCDVENETTATIEIEVADTGSGMSERKVKEVRKAFMKKSRSMADHFGGLGIGLAINKELVDRMNGKMSVRSTEGIGSIFGLKLTLKKGEEIEARNECDLSKKSALLINDSVDDRKKLEEYFAEWGIRTEHAGHGGHAISKLMDGINAKAPFDFAIIDLHKMKSAGMNLAKQLRKDKAFKALRIVLFALDRDAITANKAAKIGVDVFIPKPIRKQVVYDALAMTMGFDDMSDHSQLITNHTVDEVREQQQRRALLVEDNEVNQIIAKGALKKLGISTDVTNNGEEAVDAVKEKHYDLILMDCEMPVMDGFEATRIIREWEKTIGAHTPIVALTADDSDACHSACMSAGMDEYMQKPFRADQLEFILQKLQQAS